MKKLLMLFIPLFALPLFSGCKGEDYKKYLSEVTSDVFAVETEDYSLTLSCIAREVPYVSDGVACPMQNVVEIVLKPQETDSAASYCVVLEGMPALSGELSYRTAKGDWFLSGSVENFPEGSVSLSIQKDGETASLTARSVKTENTLTPEEALSFAVNAESELISRMTAGKQFQGEFRVRLLKRGSNYYYVSIVGKAENAALLLNAETGDVLARRVR